HRLRRRTGPRALHGERGRRRRRAEGREARLTRTRSARVPYGALPGPLLRGVTHTRPFVSDRRAPTRCCARLQAARAETRRTCRCLQSFLPDATQAEARREVCRARQPERMEKRPARSTSWTVQGWRPPELPVNHSLALPLHSNS